MVCIVPHRDENKRIYILSNYQKILDFDSPAQACWPTFSFKIIIEIRFLVLKTLEHKVIFRCTPGCDGSEDPMEPPKYFGNTFARWQHPEKYWKNWSGQECPRASCWCIRLRELQYQRWHTDRVLHRFRGFLQVFLTSTLNPRNSHHQRQDGSVQVQPKSRDEQWRTRWRSFHKDCREGKNVPSWRQFLERQPDHHKVSTKTWLDNVRFVGGEQDTRAVNTLVSKETGSPKLKT